MTIDIDAFRRTRHDAPLPPYEALTGLDRWSVNTYKSAKTIMQDGWTLNQLPTVPLVTPLAWDEVCREDRSWTFQLHSWDFLGHVLAAHSATGERQFIEFALRLVLDWARQYPTRQHESTFAWYDMAVGLRAYRLSYVLDVAARADWVDDDTVLTLLEAAIAHADVLADDDVYPDHSNHGFYFAAGQAALGRRFPDIPTMADASKQAGERLAAMLDLQFTDEGVHREHSPDYHRMVFETFSGLVEAGLLIGAGLAERDLAIQESLAWFVLPNGTLARFGDTAEVKLGHVAQSLARHPALRLVATGGQEGSPPGENIRAFPESGYIVFRDGWPAPGDDVTKYSYLAQTCAFHSRVHKHADDLSFVWYDRGEELLVDAGRYGYLGHTETGSELWKDGHWYSDPNRIFVESTRAHNTVEVDGRNHPRVGVEPYGSALESWGEWGELQFSVAACSYRSIHHRRVLVLSPSRWLLVLDRLVDADGDDHDFRQRFQLSPSLELSDANDPLSPFVGGSLQLPLHCLSLSKTDPMPVVRGQSEPEMAG